MELDALVAALRDEGDDRVAGARMMGGGFGGCTLNLVDHKFKDAIIDNIAKSYKATFGHAMKAYKVNISDGTCLLNPSDFR